MPTCLFASERCMPPEERKKSMQHEFAALQGARPRRRRPRGAGPRTVALEPLDDGLGAPAALQFL